MIFTLSKLLHPLNVLSSIEVTPDGIVIDLNDEHLENALNPIDVTDVGILMDVRLWQFSKAQLPIDVRFEVIVTVSKLLHPLNV